MKRLKIFILTLWVIAAATAQEALCFKLDSLLDDPLFETTQVAVMVYDLTTDTPLYTHNHRQLMRPASCMKLVTAITALDQLGSNYEYKTRICYTGLLINRRASAAFFAVIVKSFLIKKWGIL